MLVIVGVKCREGFLHTVPITPVDNTFGYMITDKLGWTPEGRRARGRPKTTWRRTVEKDLRNKGGWKSWEVPKAVAQDRKRWSVSVRTFCAYWRDET